MQKSVGKVLKAIRLCQEKEIETVAKQMAKKVDFIKKVELGDEQLSEQVIKSFEKNYCFTREEIFVLAKKVANGSMDWHNLLITVAKMDLQRKKVRLKREEEKEFIGRLGKMVDQEESKLMDQYYIQGDMKAREKLIIKLLPIIDSVIDHRFVKDDQYQEMFNEGVLVLEKTIDAYNLKGKAALRTRCYITVARSLESKYSNHIKGAYKAQENTNKEEDFIIVDEPVENEGLHNVFLEQLMTIVGKYLNTRSKWTRSMLRYHWGLDDGEAKTFTETAVKFNCSSENVRQTNHRAQDTIRAMLKQNMKIQDEDLYL